MGGVERNILGERTASLVCIGAVSDVSPTAYMPGPNQFAIAELADFGDTYFVGWEAHVLWDAGGAAAAPQAEHQTVTVYDSGWGGTVWGGRFTTAAFTAAVGVGDRILLVHPSLSAILAGLDVPAADVAVNLLERDVIGNKTGTANYVADGATSIIRYVKALITSVMATEIADTHAHANNVAEQDVFEYNLNDAYVESIWLDCVNLTQTTTFRVYYKIDAANQRHFETVVWNPADPDGLLIRCNFGIDGGHADDLKLTCQSTVAEGAVRNIPFELIYRIRS